MVVEDEPDIYEILLTLFGMWGIDGRAFVDGEEAVAWINEVDNGTFQGELPELALLDIRLPGEIHGPEVGERIRKSPKLKHICIVLITAYPLRPDDYKAIMAQTEADKLVNKPLPKPHELQKLLDDLLAARRVRLAAQAEEQSITASTATLPVDGPTPTPVHSSAVTPKTTRPDSSVTVTVTESDDTEETEAADAVPDLKLSPDPDEGPDRTPPPDSQPPRKPSNGTPPPKKPGA
jgi:CheY-like chemotaxis protein